jgi:hypothetical protein
MSSGEVRPVLCKVLHLHDPAVKVKLGGRSGGMDGRSSGNRTGNDLVADPVNGLYEAFLFVGIAYFLTATSR